MLSARYLASSADDIQKIYSELENRIICDMARRIKNMGKVTDATTWQAKIYNEIGGVTTSIKNYLKSYEADALKEFKELYKDAKKKSAIEDLSPIAEGSSRKMSDDQLQTLNATLKKLQSAAIVTGSAKVEKEAAEGGAIKVFSGLQRLTMTIAKTGQQDFINACNAAYMDVSTGAFDYKTALKNAVDGLAKKGISTVEYTDSGKTINRSIESAVRSNIMTGINQTAAQQTLDNCEATGTDLVEVSAHKGARPEHAAFQGKVYCLNGERDYIDGNGNTQHAFNFYDVCHPGEATGICGINCRHSYYPYFEGTPQEYSNGELSEMKDPKVEYKKDDGTTTELSQYDAEQIQRGLERNVRKYKLEADAEKAAGVDASAASAKVSEYQAKLRKFCESTNLKRDYSREFVGNSGKKTISPKTTTPKTSTTTATKKTATATKKPAAKTTAPAKKTTAPVAKKATTQEILLEKVNALKDEGHGDVQNPIKLADENYRKEASAILNKARKEGVEEYEKKTVKISDIVTRQEWLDKSKLEDFIKAYDPKKSKNDDIRAVYYNGKYMLIDGNHRTTLALLKGEKEISISVLKKIKPQEATTLVQDPRTESQRFGRLFHNHLNNSRDIWNEKVSDQDIKEFCKDQTSYLGRMLGVNGQITAEKVEKELKSFFKTIDDYIKDDDTLLLRNDRLANLLSKIDDFEKDPRLKSIFETGTGQGSHSLDARHSWEKNIDPNIGKFYAVTKANTLRDSPGVYYGKNYTKNSKLRPVYGEVIARSELKNSAASAQYGETQFIFNKDKIRKRTSFTLGNSSNMTVAFQESAAKVISKGAKNSGGYIYDTLARGSNLFPKDKTTGKRTRSDYTYIEMQAWGGIDFAAGDVVEVITPKGNAQLPGFDRFEAILKKYGIKLTFKA